MTWLEAILATPPMLLGAAAIAWWHYVLWGGLVILLVAPAILSRTPWSESRPLSICVTLSVLAHVLLMTYAYAIRLPYSDFARSGLGDADGPVISLNLLGGDEHDSDPSNSASEDAPLTEPRESLPNEADESPMSKPTDADVKPEIEPMLPEPPPMPPPLADLPMPAADSGAENRAATVDTEPREMEIGATPPSPPPAPVGPMFTSVTDRDMIETTPPVRPGDRQPIPQIYRNRVASRRLSLALRYGGNINTETAVDAALLWLVRHQSPDGRWDPQKFGAGRENRALGQDRGGAGAHADTGITALALLALLGAGETHLQGKHRETVQHGLEFLLRNQRTDGELAGSAELFARMYCHGMSTLALSEAYAMTGDDRIRPYLERAVHFSVNAQDSTSGGWRYRPGDSGDMSQFGWQLMALKSAQLGGFEIPDRTRAGMLRFLESATSGSQKGLASYRPGERPSRTMTAESMVCRHFLSVAFDSQLKEGEAFVREELPSAKGENFYYWYYGTLALFQTQGESWPAWNEALQRQLLTRQHTDGDDSGSWDPDPVWGAYGGRVFSTALGALCLEVYYRYLPLYQTARSDRPGTSAR